MNLKDKPGVMAAIRDVTEVAKQSQSYAYQFVPDGKGLIKVYVDARGEVTLTQTDKYGR